LPDSTDFKRECIEREHPGLSVRRQCELLGLNRSSWYYQSAGESAENLEWMRRIDEQYLKTPFYGSRKMADVLGIDRKRAQRLMRRSRATRCFANADCASKSSIAAAIICSSSKTNAKSKRETARNI